MNGHTTLFLLENSIELSDYCAAFMLWTICPGSKGILKWDLRRKSCLHIATLVTHDGCHGDDATRSKLWRSRKLRDLKPAARSNLGQWFSSWAPTTRRNFNLTPGIESKPGWEKVVYHLSQSSERINRTGHVSGMRSTTNFVFLKGRKRSSCITWVKQETQHVLLFKMRDSTSFPWTYSAAEKMPIGN